MEINELLQKLILGDITLSQGLLFCKVMYSDCLSEQSYQWICNELDHYDKPELLPEYRVLDCVIKVVIDSYYTGRSTQVLDTTVLDTVFKDSEKTYASPTKMLIRQGIESLEQSMKTDSSTVSMEFGSEQINLLMRCYSISPGCTIEKMYQECRIEQVKNIIPCVRNRLVNILQTEVLPKTHKTNGVNIISQKKRIFISYGWDDNAHCEWVRCLANRLSQFFDVIIDVELPLGTELNSFMEQMISEADRVLLILTPKYKEKADARKNGVGYESVLISTELYHDQGSTKFIPVIRKGGVRDSYPLYLGTRKGLDMTDDNLFEEKFSELVEDLKRS